MDYEACELRNPGERLAIFASIKHGRHGRNWQRHYTRAWADRLGIYRLSRRTRPRTAHA